MSIKKLLLEGEETKKNILTRRSRVEDIKNAGFNSETEAVLLEQYYEAIIKNNY